MLKQVQPDNLMNQKPRQLGGVFSLAYILFKQVC